MEKRFNPFTEAIANARSGVSGLLKQTPPPPDVADAIEEYNWRVSDPEGALPEWQAIYDLHGVQGLTDYMNNMKKMKDTWGL